METSWYVLKVFPGKERQMTEQLNQQISIGRIKNILRFVCPVEKEFVIVKNKKILREKVLYSGYLYFETQVLLNEDELKVVASIPNVMSIMGNREPMLMKSYDVKRIIKDEVLQEHIETKKLKYIIGENIIVKEGAFRNFDGVISKIYDDKVDVDVKIFGRTTPITLPMDQISKLE